MDKADGPRRLGVVLPLAMGVGPISLYALSALSPLVLTQLHLSRSEFGSLATVTFVMGAVGSMAAARATTALGGRFVLLTLFVAAGMAVGVVASATSLVWLFVGVAVSGLAQSLSNPATNDLISAFVPAPRQGVLVGVKQSGVQMSQFFAGLALPTAALVLGWRAAVAVTATLAAAGWWLTLRGVPRPLTVLTRNSVRPQLPGEVWWLSGYMFLMAAGMQATNVYLPLFSYQRTGVGTTAAGLTVAVVGGMGLTSRIVWGRVSGRRPTRVQPLLLGLAAASVGAATLLVVAQLTGQAWWVWTAAAVDGASAVAANVVVVIAVVGGMERRVVSTASGVVAVAMYLGFASGPLTFGLLVDNFGGYTSAWIAVGTAYALAAAVVICWRQLRPTPGDDAR